mmetsp:Transcript_26432/g.78184  ORF Transcript_26432/g.78184 Transcript_26432/m.78184 type:complete len:161 (-) Transcript_26432:161-643(-)
MFWAARTLKCAAKAISTGAATALVATTVSCGMAIAIEGTANRIVYRFFPHWYRDVQYAYGLPDLQNDPFHSHYHADGIMASEAMVSPEEHMEEEPNMMDMDVWTDGEFMKSDPAVDASRTLGLLPIETQKRDGRKRESPLQRLHKVNSITGEVFSTALTG